MWRQTLPWLILLAGCSKGPEADLPSISSARSLAAEWAMLNQQAADHRVTGNFTQTMRSSLHEQLQTTASGLNQPNSRYGQEIRALLAEPADAPSERLRAHARALKQIEDSLESA